MNRRTPTRPLSLSAPALLLAAALAAAAGCASGAKTRDISEPVEVKSVAPPKSAPLPTAKGARRAIIVGVSNYAAKAIPSLAFARTDAQGVYDFFTDETNNLNYARENVTLLLDEDATLERIRGAILAVNEAGSKAATPDESILFYFAGHGAVDVGPGGEVRGSYLVPSNARAVEAPSGGLALDTSSGLAIAKLQELFQVNRAQSLLIVLDACFSGDTGRSVSRVVLDARQQAQVDAGLERLANAGTGRAVITATAPNQPALELGNLRGGLFTHYFLLSLGADANRDGKVTLQEAYDYVYTKVREESVAHGRLQTPTVKENRIGVPILRVLPRVNFRLGLAVHYMPGGQKVTARADAPQEPERVPASRGYAVDVDVWDSLVPLNVCVLRFIIDAKGARSARLMPDGEVALAPPVRVAEGAVAHFPDEGDTGAPLADLGQERDADVLYVLIATERAFDMPVLDRLERRMLEVGGAGPAAAFVKRATGAAEAAEDLKEAALLYAWVREGRGAPESSLMPTSAPPPPAGPKDEGGKPR
jgi:hypothetical protein